MGGGGGGGMVAWVDVFVPLMCVMGAVYAWRLWAEVGKVAVRGPEAAGGGLKAGLLAEEGVDAQAVAERAADIQESIATGAQSFLMTEYKYMVAFVGLFSILLVALLGAGSKEDPTPYSGRALHNAIFTTIAFVLGAVTSIVAGYVGMKIATYANARTALEARSGVDRAFALAFRSGAVMGLSLTCLGLVVLYFAVLFFRASYGDDWVGLFEAIAGYGLGGSTMALFGRVGGGIYTKAADVGADLVGKVEKDIPEDDPRNPAVIADNVGDNVGDIAGMGSDLFGSFAESTCAALVVSSLGSMGSGDNATWKGMLFPLAITAIGIPVSVLCTLYGTAFRPASDIPSIEPTLKRQLQLSTLVMVPLSFIIARLSLPTEFEVNLPGGEMKTVSWSSMAITVSLGLVAGYVIGHFTEVYTSNRYKGVQEVSDACRMGAATNVIYGLALGYYSCIVPCFALVIVIFGSFSLAGMYGIACAALGMLGTLSTCLAIDAYGPISDNAGGIAEMAGMGEEIRRKTDALDAAGNTTAAIGKGFAIGSAALVSLALFGAYVTRAEVDIADASILDPAVFCGLLLGAMLPYWFSAMTMKAVGIAALEMVEEVRRQFRDIPGLM